MRRNSTKINISGRLFKGVKRARAPVAESFVTYPSRLSHACTCLYALQIITEKTCVHNFLCFIFYLKKKKKIVFYSSVYKIEPESLENADIRFLSSWSFIYFSTCFGTRLVHLYFWFIIYAALIVILELGWFWYICGVVFMGVYIFNFCLTAFWVYLSSDI